MRTDVRAGDLVEYGVDAARAFVIAIIDHDDPEFLKRNAWIKKLKVDTLVVSLISTNDFSCEPLWWFGTRGELRVICRGEDAVG